MGHKCMADAFYSHGRDINRLLVLIIFGHKYHKICPFQKK